MEKATCGICESHPLGIRWTDTHGIGACLECGAPHRVYHYDENDKRIEKPSECLILPEYKDLIKRYWAEKRRNVAPGAFNFPGSSYEVASEQDFKEFRDWWDANKIADQKV